MRAKKAIGLLTAAALAALCAILLERSGAFSTLEPQSFDLRQRLTFRPEKRDQSIKIIVIDQGSLDHFAAEEHITWPWPRELYEPVIKFLKDAGARAVAFDMLFSEPSSYGVHDDEAFRDALKHGPPSVIASAEKSGTPLLPIELLRSSGTSVGNVTSIPDKDGIFRSVSLGGSPKDGSFRFVSALHSLLTHTNHEGPIVKRTLRFHGPSRTYDTYPIDAIIRSYQNILNNLSPIFNPELFKDSIVLVGVDAPGLLDLKSSPAGSVYSGVEFNATALDNLLHSEFIREPTKAQNVLLSLFLSFAICMLLLVVSSTSVQLLAALGIGAIYSLITVQFALNGIWIPLVSPLAALLFSFVLGLSVQYSVEGRTRKMLRSTFEHYVSPEVIEEIIKDPSKLSLGGERREITAFFSDLAGFTSLSEKLDPGTLSKLLNEYLSAMTKIILASGGTIDKFEGDAIVAFWNAPLPVSDHPTRAVQCALECQKKLQTLTSSFESRYGAKLSMRIGIATGEANVGNFGSKDRFNYTAIGDTMNLASRLEGANKELQTSILISKGTAEKVSSDINVQNRGTVRLAGKSEAVEVFEPLT